ncbi:MAG: glycosyltransferase [Alphaproteobacteria bacterium]|nr:glycosyltransferase [Alphaproteobacteria bacterium]MBV9371159.1 glycosyltransferase [Alphaproteobacteria bacterium]MBV9901196.1 glycosyltransferase [Alphaproteobacteria bacterium]
MIRVTTLSTLFPDAARPGFGRFVERQTQGLAAREGVSVEVVAGLGLPPWPLPLHPRWRALRALPGAERRGGLRVVRPRFLSLPGSGNAARLARAALPALRAFRPDVIDAEFFWPDGVAAAQLARALGIPFSIKARGSDIAHWAGVPAIRRQMLEAAEAAGGLLAVSEALRREMIALGMPPDRIRVHHAGIDLDRFRLPGAPAGRVVASVGNLVPVKGHKLLLEAFRGVPDAVLLIAGEGPERAALEAAAGDRVRFLGAVGHDALPRLLGEARVMALASEREGLANAWLEALACGTPIVVPDVGGAREVVDRPAAGRIVPRDAQAIAAAITELLDRPPERAAVRAAAERFSWARNAAELEAHLRSVSAQRH